jgi:hypothetical protein
MNTGSLLTTSVSRPASTKSPANAIRKALTTQARH